jgi:hypothetical protein
MRYPHNRRPPRRLDAHTKSGAASHAPIDASVGGKQLLVRALVTLMVICAVTDYRHRRRHPDAEGGEC